MSMTYIAPREHACPVPKDRVFSTASYPAGSVWVCADCDTGWVVRLTQEWPPRRVWKRIRWWHFSARRRLREKPAPVPHARLSDLLESPRPNQSTSTSSTVKWVEPRADLKPYQDSPAGRQRFVRVNRCRLGPDEGRWFVFCDVCGDDFMGFNFRPLRWARDQLTASRWAHQHARRHHEQACPCCGHMKPIKDLDVAGRAAS